MSKSYGQVPFHAGWILYTAGKICTTCEMTTTEKRIQVKTNVEAPKMLQAENFVLVEERIQVRKDTGREL
jgi:hypothetical protein